MEPADEIIDAGRDRASQHGGNGSVSLAFADEEEPVKPSRDYRITNESRIGEGGLRYKAERNLDAIQLLKIIEREGRSATDDEKHILARYSGWGAMPAVFDYYTGRQDEWNETRDTVKQLLTDDEFRAARASTSNAHYTSPLVVEAIWSGLERLGVKAGMRVLEPSLGTGNFFGLMPEHLTPKSMKAGVELDLITARIAKQLYQDATIFEVGFQDAPFPDGFFDVAVGNVPFGNYGVHDPQYKSWQTSSIHDYFFVKTLDKLRPGGVLALITSRYTMDKRDDDIRSYLASQADLLGAIRLPNKSFKDNAGTVVTTDILFLQKREAGQEPVGPAWQNADDYNASGIEGEDFALNEYYIEHPEMMLGKMQLVHSRFDKQPELIGELSPDALEAAIARLPRNVYAPRPELPEAAPVPKLPDADFKGIKNGAYTIVDNALGIYENGAFTPISLTPKKEARVRGMMKLRDAVREVFRTQLEDAGDEAITEARQNLNLTYDRFVREHGCLSNRDNSRTFVDDPDAPLLLSLEESYDEATSKAKKAAIFAQRTLERYKPVEKVETAAEALAVSLNEYGRIEWGRMVELTGQKPAALQRELGDMIFQNPESDNWETADEYLSGNVRQKLAFARSAADLVSTFERNIAALEAIQPTDLTPAEITARLGATWIPADDLADFVAEVIEASKAAVRVDYSNDLATWTITAKDAVKSNVANLTTYGTSRFTALNLLEDALNGVVPTAYDTIHVNGEEKRVVNEQLTLEAREAQQKLKDMFAEWIWKDDDRSSRLAEIYNEKFNSTRLRSYDGSHLTFPGMNKAVLRKGDFDPHQKNAVWRILQGDSTLLAHCVGAGKTWIMTAAAMEAKRIGLVKKSMVVVPNHLVEQWGTAFLQLYPQANIFVAGKEHFQSGKRQKAMSRIATGNYDAVIVSHKTFELLPVSDALFDAYLQKELDALEDAIREANQDKGNRRIVKMLATAQKRLEKKIEDRAKREKKDNTITFEELGIDRIFVDEADIYKNLGFITKMSRVAGLPNSNSNRATDMHIKTRYLRDKNDGKGVVFATGTPISNTMAELYTMQRYLNPEGLEAAGLANFDAWAANFGEAVTALELEPSGAGYRMHTRFARFVNLPELLRIYRYVTEGSFDAYMWQTLETKAKFIQQVMNGDTSVRTAEDINGGALTYAEIKAIASGNPAVMQKVKVDTEVRKLDTLRTAHLKRQFQMRGKISPTETAIKSGTDQLAKVKADIETRNQNHSEEFSMVVAGKLFEGKDARERAAKALDETILAWRSSQTLKGCGKIAGFDVLCQGKLDGSIATYLRGEASYNVNYNPDNPIGTLMSIERTLRGLESVQSHLEIGIANDEKALAEYLLQSEKPFEHEERLKELLAEQAKLNDALELNKDDKQAVAANDDDGSNTDEDVEYLDIDNLMSVDEPERFDNDNEVLRPTGTDALTP